MRNGLWPALAWLVVAAGVLTPRVAGQEPDPLANAPRITQAEFKRLWDEGNVVVVDVRDVTSFRMGHIPGAVCIPLDQVAAQAGRFQAEKRPIVTYCA